MKKPRIEREWHPYEPRLWCAIKIFPTEDVAATNFRYDTNYLYFKCNGLSTDVTLCEKCRFRFGCFTGREVTVINKKLYEDIGANYYTPIEILRKYMFGKK